VVFLSVLISIDPLKWRNLMKGIYSKALMVTLAISQLQSVFAMGPAAKPVAQAAAQVATPALNAAREALFKGYARIAVAGATLGGGAVVGALSRRSGKAPAIVKDAGLWVKAQNIVTKKVVWVPVAVAATLGTGWIVYKIYRHYRPATKEEGKKDGQQPSKLKKGLKIGAALAGTSAVGGAGYYFWNGIKRNGGKALTFANDYAVQLPWKYVVKPVLDYTVVPVWTRGIQAHPVIAGTVAGLGVLGGAAYKYSDTLAATAYKLYHKLPFTGKKGAEQPAAPTDQPKADQPKPAEPAPAAQPKEKQPAAKPAPEVKTQKSAAVTNLLFLQSQISAMRVNTQLEQTVRARIAAIVTSLKADKTGLSVAQVSWFDGNLKTIEKYLAKNPVDSY
jgi:hypothetical protein